MKRLLIIITTALMTLTVCQHAMAQQRRPIDREHPLWLIHIDVWNSADPHKIIDLLP